MTHAYDELLADRAADVLGRMLDFAVHSLHTDADNMLRLFVASGISDAFGRGDIRFICGMSGTELAYIVLEQSGLPCERVTPRHTISLSNEYWCGFALAKLQHESGMGFDRLITPAPAPAEAGNGIPVFKASAIIREYGNLKTELLEKLPWDTGEAERNEELRKLGESFASGLAGRFSSDGLSSLKEMRIKNGLSQSQLAKAAGVPVRTIQQYEQGQKDIRRARAEYVISLSRALHCDPVRLLGH